MEDARKTRMAWLNGVVTALPTAPAQSDQDAVISAVVEAMGPSNCMGLGAATVARGVINRYWDVVEAALRRQGWTDPTATQASAERNLRCSLRAAELGDELARTRGQHNETTLALGVAREELATARAQRDALTRALADEKAAHKLTQGQLNQADALLGNEMRRYDSDRDGRSG